MRQSREGSLQRRIPRSLKSRQKARVSTITITIISAYRKHRISALSPIAELMHSCSIVTVSLERIMKSRFLAALVIATSVTSPVFAGTDTSGLTRATARCGLRPVSWRRRQLPRRDTGGRSTPGSATRRCELWRCRHGRRVVSGCSQDRPSPRQRRHAANLFRPIMVQRHCGY